MGSFVAPLVIVLLIVGMWLGIRLLRRKFVAAAESMSRLAREGVTTSGRITVTEKRRMSRGEFEYFVTYAFETKDGTEVTKELRVQASRFDEYAEGQPIEIVYLPSDPSLSATKEVVDRVRGESVPLVR